MKKFRELFNFLHSKELEEIPVTTVEEGNSLIEHGLIYKSNSSIHSNERSISNNNSNNQKYRFTSIGLIYIFNNKYTYSPDFLIEYENDIILQKLLFKYFQPHTMKIATAKFFNIITDYLSDLSNYLINLSANNHNSVTEELSEEIEHSLKTFALILGFKIIILYNEANLISSSIGAENDKAILAIHQVETNMKRNLSKDPKFLGLISKISYEFNSGYKDIVNFRV